MAKNSTNAGALIPIIDNNGKKAVNARDLHSFLESRKDFSSWIKDRIDRCDLIENVDYVLLTPKGEQTGRGGHNKIDYVLSVDASKELSMIEGNEKGKQARRYFIECEKQLVENTKKNIGFDSPRNAIEIKMNVADWASKFLNLNATSKLMLAKPILNEVGLPVPDYVDSKGILKSATELLKARNCGLSAQGFNLRAIEKGILREIERNTSKGKKKLFKCITEKGLTYGENQVNPNNPKETQPLWYESKFDELLALLDIKVGRAAV